MAWSFTNDQPIYLQIVEQIKRRIISGVYPVGSQLPTVRQFADEIGVNPNTVQKSMLQLEEEKLVYSQGTAGRFIIHEPTLPDMLLQTLVNKKVRAFLTDMSSIGLTAEQTIAAITKISEEDIQ